MKENKMYKMNKPVIVAICGKSATGKDTLVSSLFDMLKAIEIPTNIIVSDTTRPPRLSERDGVDYNFLTKNKFYYKIRSKKYLEYSLFNEWLYGTDKAAISSNSINIGIFNANGISRLVKHQNDYNIICIYLRCNFIQRLIRSYKREHKLKIEYFRRAFADYYDFKNIKNVLKHFNNHFIFNSNQIPTASIADFIISQLK